MGPLRILIAPNAFKNSISASAAAEAIQTGLEQSSLACSCILHPIADGGDGTGELLIDRLEASLQSLSVDDPLGRRMIASFGVGKDTAVIELAAASGLRLLNPQELDPLQASTTGTGQLISAALNNGVKEILLAVGGSATVDGGIGILHALGIRFLDATGQSLPPVPARLPDLVTIDLSGLHPRARNTKFIILCDVENTLLGEQGAAAIFGPQKGATPDKVLALDASLAQLRAITLSTTGKDMAAVKYGGAAGGTAAGLYAMLDAELVNGAEYFLQLTDLNQRLENCDLVITGEGSIDEQTLQGKGPFAVAKRARSFGIPVIGLAGKVPVVPSKTLEAYFKALLAIGNGPTDLQEAIRSTAANLTRTAAAIGEMLALGAEI